MAEVKAFDMSQYQRLVHVEGGRVTGTFAVMPPIDPAREAWVKTHEVTVWDSAAHNHGRLFYSKDLSFSVENGEVTLGWFNTDKRADIDGALDELKVAVLAALAAFPEPEREKARTEDTNA